MRGAGAGGQGKLGWPRWPVGKRANAIRIILTTIATRMSPHKTWKLKVFLQMCWKPKHALNDNFCCCCCCNKWTHNRDSDERAISKYLQRFFSLFWLRIPFEPYLPPVCHSSYELQGNKIWKYPIFDIPEIADCMQHNFWQGHTYIETHFLFEYHNIIIYQEFYSL